MSLYHLASGELKKENNKLKEEIERLNNIIKEQGLEDKLNYYAKGLEGSLKEYQEEVKRLNNIIDEIYTFLSQYTITHTWQKLVIEDTIKYIDELKGSGSNG